MRKAGGDAPVTATPKAAVARVVPRSAPAEEKNVALTSALMGGIEEVSAAAAPKRNLPAVVPSRTAAVDSDGFDEGDIRLPRLTIVNGNGKMSAQYSQGDLVYGEEVIYPSPRVNDKQVLRFIPLSISKQWRVNLTPEEQSAGVQSEVFANKDEALAYDPDGTFAWIGRQKPRFSPSAKCILVLEKPEGIEHLGFTFDVEGKSYAPAVYYAGGGAFNDFVLPLHNTRRFACVEKVDGVNQVVTWAKFWNLEVAKVKAGDFTVFRPKIKITNEVTAGELRALCEQVIGAKHSIDEDGE